MVKSENWELLYKGVPWSSVQEISGYGVKRQCFFIYFSVLIGGSWKATFYLICMLVILNEYKWVVGISLQGKEVLALSRLL